MFYIIVLIILVILFAVNNQQIDTTSKRMLSIFIVYWLLSIFLSKIRVYGLNEVHDFTYLLVGLGVISFSLGFLISAKKRKPNFHIIREDISGSINKIVDSVPYRVILVVSSIYIYTLLVVFFGRMAAYGTLANVRTDYYEGELYGPLFGQLNAFVLNPLYLVTLPIFAYTLLYKRNWFCLISGFYLFGYESLGGGRIGYIRILLGVVFIAYCLLQTFQSNKKRGYTIAIIGGSLVFILVSLVSGARKGEIGTSSSSRRVGVEVASEHLVTYTAGPIVAFDHSVYNDYSQLIGGYQYGNLTLTPVISTVNLFSSRLGFTFSKSINKLVEYKQGSMISISPNHLYWNALYTANLYFYNDFGVLGVILFPFLFGLIISSMITKMYKYKSVYLIMIVSYCFWLMMYSVMDYGFASPYVLIALLVMYYIGTKKKYVQ